MTRQMLRTMLYSCVVLFNREECCQRLMSTFYIRLVVKNNNRGPGNWCCWKVLEKHSKHWPDCFCSICLIELNPFVNGWIMSAFLIVDDKCGWYQIWQPLHVTGLAIVFHKKWHLNVDYTLTPPLKKKKKGEESHLRLGRWGTSQGRSTRITIDDAGGTGLSTSLPSSSGWSHYK